MNILIDICKRSFYLNLFIVVIPIIAYMIHNGSSATVALVQKYFHDLGNLEEPPYRLALR